jgi:hypothetical protein
VTDPRQAQFRALFGKLRIDDQLTFYTARRDEYRNAHRQAIIVRNALLVLAAVCGGVGLGFDERVRAGLGVAAAVFGGLAAAVTGFESLIGFARLEKLYSDAASNLMKAKIDWLDLAVDADEAAEVARVEEIFQTENGQWGQLEVETAPVVAPPTREGDAG